MNGCVYPVYAYYWFWLLALGVLFIIIGFIIWNSINPNNTPVWVWVVLFGGFVLAILGFILFIWQWFIQSNNGRPVVKRNRQKVAMTPTDPQKNLRERLVEGKTIWQCN